MQCSVAQQNENQTRIFNDVKVQKLSFDWSDRGVEGLGEREREIVAFERLQVFKTSNEYYQWKSLCDEKIKPIGVKCGVA